MPNFFATSNQKGQIVRAETWPDGSVPPLECYSSGRVDLFVGHSERSMLEAEVAAREKTDFGRAAISGKGDKFHTNPRVKVPRRRWK